MTSVSIPRLTSILAVALLLPLTGTLLAQGKLENPTKLYIGKVTSSDGTPLEAGKVLVFEDPYPNIVTSSKINAELGYSVQLDPEKIYVFRVEAPGYFSREFIFSTPAGNEYLEITEDLTVDPIPLDSVLFSGTPFAPESEAFEGASLDETVEFLKENPTVLVTIDVGLEEDKVDPVTKKRVGAIKDLFEENGLSLTRITWSRDLSSPFNTYRFTITGFRPDED